MATKRPKYGYKKVDVFDSFGVRHSAIAKIIPYGKIGGRNGRYKDKFFSLINKSRCAKANVVSITAPHGERQYKTAWSKYDPEFKYRVGELVKCKGKFRPDRKNCGIGIHFFWLKRDAEAY